jgi:hypothetical protein
MKSTSLGDVIDLPSTGLLAKGPAEKGAESKAPSGRVSVLRTRVKAVFSAAARSLGRASSSPGAWMAITCLLLGLSGAVRYWRSTQFYEITEATRESPFTLADLPKTIGNWMDDGAEVEFDPLLARSAGSSDHIARNYSNKTTGETVSVLALYGLASQVAPHTADICYPSAGYGKVGTAPMTNYELKIPGSGKVAHYRGGAFAKRLGGSTQYTEVVSAFRHNGKWLADTRDLWKTFRYKPGMYKIQLARVVTGFDIEDSPSVALLGELMQEIETRLDQKATKKEVGKTGLKGIASTKGN